MSVSFLLYLLVGKLLLFFGMEFAKGNGITKGFIGRLLSCDLCGGFGLYGILSLLLGEVLFTEYFYVPILSNIITGGISSFGMHLLSLGWRLKFETITIE